MLRVRGKSAADASRAELDHLLAEAECAAQDLGACEARLAAQGRWLDAHHDHPRWEERRETWRAGLRDRARLVDQIASLARRVDAIWASLGEPWGDPTVDVWHLRHVHAPYLGLFWEPGDVLSGEPHQYAPV